MVALLRTHEQYARRYNAASGVVGTRQCGRTRLVPGSDVVLELHEFNAYPVPDAAEGYWFFLQIAPDLVKEEQELIIPDTGVRPFLSRVLAPACQTTESLGGRLRILSVRDTTLEVWLAVQSQDLNPNWRFEGEVKFESAIMPR